MNSIPEILEDIRSGKIVVVVDDSDRENEGDLVCAAQFVDAEIVNFMLTEARGLLTVALSGRICDHLMLPAQYEGNLAPMHGTAFTVSVDALPRFGITTGVSANERARTIQRLADESAEATDFSRPGHIQPLRAMQGGVLVRRGHTEAAVDLCGLAGLRPAAAIIEIMKPDGEMARQPDLREFCDKHELKMCSVAGIIEYISNH